MKTVKVLQIISLLVLTPMMAGANPFFDFYGFSYLDGPANTPGTGITVPMRLDEFQPEPALPIDLVENEGTLLLEDLVIESVEEHNGILVLTYAAGGIRIFVDPSRNGEWAEYPPNAQVPGSFEDGILILYGSFIECIQVFDTLTGVGTVQGLFDFEGGERFDELSTPEGWRFFGGTTTNPLVGIPEGYEMAWDPQLIEPDAIATRTTTWGEMKSGYKN